MRDYWKCRDFSNFYKTLKSSLKKIGWLANGRSSTSTYWVRASQAADEVELLITQPIKESDIEPSGHVGFAIDARCSLWGGEIALDAALAGSPFAGGASPMLLRGAGLIVGCPIYLGSIACFPIEYTESELCNSLVRAIGEDIMPIWVDIFNSVRPGYQQLRMAGVSDYVYMMEAIGFYLAHDTPINDEDAALLEELFNRQSRGQASQSHLESMSMKAEVQLLDQIRWLVTKLPNR